LFDLSPHTIESWRVKVLMHYLLYLFVILLNSFVIFINEIAVLSPVELIHFLIHFFLRLWFLIFMTRCNMSVISSFSMWCFLSLFNDIDFIKSLFCLVTFFNHLQLCHFRFEMEFNIPLNLDIIELPCVKHDCTTAYQIHDDFFNKERTPE